MTPARRYEAFIDGASHGNPGPSGIGVVLRQGRAVVREVSEPIGEATNNVAEYFALLYALAETLRLGGTELTVKTDSELLARQLMGRYQVRDPWLRRLCGLALRLTEAFRSWHIEHVPREANAHADRLATQGARRAARGLAAALSTRAL